MSAGSLSRRYAKALMDIGAEDGSFERMGRDLRAMADAMRSSDELTQTLTNPVFPRSEREKVAKAILQRLGASQSVVNLIRLLLERERMAILGDVSRELSAMIDDKSGRARAQAWSAQPLGAAEIAQLKASLEKISGKTIELSAEADPELLGGVVARVGDTVYDGSLRTQLRRLQNELLQHPSR